MANDPTHQFQVFKIVPIEIGGIDFSFTNASLFMVATVASAAGFLYLSTANRGLIPTRMQSVAEMAYEFIASMLREGAGKRRSLANHSAIFMLQPDLPGLEYLLSNILEYCPQL